MVPLMAQPIHPPPIHDPPDAPLPLPSLPLPRQQPTPLPLLLMRPPQLPQSLSLLRVPPHVFLGRVVQYPLEKQSYTARDFESDNSTDSSSSQTSPPPQRHHPLPFLFSSLLESPSFSQVYISPIRCNHSFHNV